MAEIQSRYIMKTLMYINAIYSEYLKLNSSK